jgi:hypothetical protein
MSVRVPPGRFKSAVPRLAGLNTSRAFAGGLNSYGIQAARSWDHDVEKQIRSEKRRQTPGFFVNSRSMQATEGIRKAMRVEVERVRECEGKRRRWKIGRWRLVLADLP